MLQAELRLDPHQSSPIGGRSVFLRCYPHCCYHQFHWALICQPRLTCETSAALCGFRLKKSGPECHQLALHVKQLLVHFEDVLGVLQLLQHKLRLLTSKLKLFPDLEETDFVSQAQSLTHVS